MIYFNCDYTEGCHPLILEKLIETNLSQTVGYGLDEHCRHAAELIRKECKAPDANVHFLVGGTQTNVTVIDAALRPYQGAICAESGHINVHETGALEATGHKCLTLSSKDGKIAAKQVEELAGNHFKDGGDEHMVQPKLVYISNPTELGTIYKKQELMELYEVCQRFGMYLFMDGARLGYGLASRENDLSLSDIAEYTDVFYIGGTKVGALFGEAVVISNNSLKQDFRYNIKQHGGMLAKGRVLGIQFETLFENGLYEKLSKHAITMADRIHHALTEYGVAFSVDSPTNQLFAILPDGVIDQLKKSYMLEDFGRYDHSHGIRRICTSWATKEENVEAFLADVKAALNRNKEMD